MPRVQIAAAAALVCLGLTGAAAAQTTPCPNSRTGTTPDATYYYTDPIVVTSAGVKPQAIDEPGLCIDPVLATRRRTRRHSHVSGDINLYSSEAGFISLTFTLDSSIGTFDGDHPGHAFQAPDQDTWADNVISGNNSTLEVFLVSMGNKHTYPYTLRYLDLNGKVKIVEPGVQNH